MNQVMIKIEPIGTNQTVLHLGETKILFSYLQPVAAIVDGVSYATTQRHSKTTQRHIYNWLPEIDRFVTHPWFQELLTVYVE